MAVVGWGACILYMGEGERFGVMSEQCCERAQHNVWHMYIDMSLLASG